MRNLFQKNWRIVLTGYGLVAFLVFSVLWLVLNTQFTETGIVCIQAPCPTTQAPWHIEFGMAVALGGILLSLFVAAVGVILLLAQFISKKV